MQRREPMDSRGRWVLGGIFLAVAAMVSASAPYVRQFSSVPFYDFIGNVLLLAALFLFMVDAGSVGGMLSDRRTAWTGTIIIAVAMIGSEVLRLFSVAPGDFLIPSALTVLRGAALVGFGALAWAVARSPRISRRYRSVIVVAAIAIIGSNVIQSVTLASPGIPPELIHPIIWSLTLTVWMTHVFGMLAISLAAILAAHHPVAEAHDASSESASLTG